MLNLFLKNIKIYKGLKKKWVR